MLAKRSNTSPPLIRSPCLAPAHGPMQQREVGGLNKYNIHNTGIDKRRGFMTIG
jgi:hypothetical protein